MSRLQTIMAAIIGLSAFGVSAFAQQTCWPGQPLDNEKFLLVRSPTFTTHPNVIEMKIDANIAFNGQYFIETIDKQSSKNFATVKKQIKTLSDYKSVHNQFITSLDIKPFVVSSDMVFSNKNGTKTAIILSNLDMEFSPSKQYRVIIALAEKPKKPHLILGNRIQILKSRSKNMGIKRSGRVEGFGTDTSAIMSRLQTPSSSKPPKQIPINHDALVSIAVKTGTSWGRCVGTHIGNGQILTARHCIGDQYIFQFGHMNATLQNTKDPADAEWNCVGSKTKNLPTNLLPAKSISSDGGKKLDVTILHVHEEFMNSTDFRAQKFKAALVSYKKHITISDQNTSTLQGPDFFSLATIWPDRLNRNIAFSPNGQKVTPQKFEKVVFSPNFDADKDYNCQILPKNGTMFSCAGNALSSNISRYGWLVGCPTEKGVSGSPLFDATAPNQSEIIAVVSSDSEVKGNCVAPTAFEPNPSH